MFLPGESQGRGSLVGCHLWGRTESDMTEATQQQQQFYYYYLLFIYSVNCSVVPDSLQPLDCNLPDFSVLFSKLAVFLFIWQSQEPVRFLWDSFY